MNNIQLYIEFLNGSLNYENEKTFVNQLASDDNFRIEFRNYAAITSAINSNIKKFGPSTALTNSLFDKIGIEPDERIDKGGAFFKKGLAIALLACLFSSITSFGIFELMQDTNKSNNSQASASFEKKAPNIAQNVKEISREDIAITKHKMSKNKSYQLVKNINDNSIEEVNTAEAQYEYTPIVNNIRAFDKSSLISKPQLVKNIHTASINPFNETSNLENSIFDKINFEIKGSQAWSMPDLISQKRSGTKFENVIFDLSYRINDDFSAGLDLRNENFKLLDNIGTDSYTQQNFTTISLCAKYRFSKVPLIKPSIGLNLGANAKGAVTRVNLGLEYEILPTFSAISNLELSSLLYKNNNAYLGSLKYGVNYGFAYKF